MQMIKELLCCNRRNSTQHIDKIKNLLIETMDIRNQCWKNIDLNLCPLVIWIGVKRSPFQD